MRWVTRSSRRAEALRAACCLAVGGLCFQDVEVHGPAPSHRRPGEQWAPPRGAPGLRLRRSCDLAVGASAGEVAAPQADLDRHLAIEPRVPGLPDLALGASVVPGAQVVTVADVGAQSSVEQAVTPGRRQVVSSSQRWVWSPWRANQASPSDPSRRAHPIVAPRGPPARRPSAQTGPILGAPSGPAICAAALQVGGFPRQRAPAPRPPRAEVFP
jgi:hypothetical protein